MSGIAHRMFVVVVVALALAAACAQVAGQPAPGPAPAGGAPAAAAPVVRPDDFMPVSQIRPGMIAVGKTVFRGTDIEDFHLEILGVIPKARVGGDVILARVLDGALVERQSGILQGMSGSPVYIGGRLIGAIAFGWTFSKEPVAGITPIADMLKALGAPARGAQPPSAAAAPGADGGGRPSSSAAPLAQPVMVGGRAVSSVCIIEPPATAPGSPAEPPGVVTLQPMGSLFLASGMSARAIDSLRQLVQPFGAAVEQGVGGSSTFPGGDLQPGAALGVQLVRGDFDATAVGTVTYVKGDQVLALGHPMMSMGDVDLTLTTAYINAIVPSYQAGMKLGFAGRAVGRLAQDRPWAVAGIIGEPAKMIPVSVTVTDGGGAGQTFNAEIAPHRLLAPGLAATVALSAVDRAWERVGEGTAEISVEIEGEGRPAIRRRDTTFSPADAAAAIAASITAPMSVLMQNEFGSMPVKAVRLGVRLTAERRTARIENISVQPGKIKAGDVLDVSVRLRPYVGAAREATPVVEKRLSVKLPPDLPDGTITLGAAGGGEVLQLQAMLGLARRRAFSLEQLLDIYQTSDRADDLVVMVALPSTGVMIEGQRVPCLPSYLVDLLTDAGSSVIEPARDYLKESAQCEWVVEGRQMTSVEVEGKPGAAKRGPRAPRPPEAPPKKAPEEQPPPPDEEREEMAPTLPVGAQFIAPPPAAGEQQKEKQAAKQPPEKEKEKPIGRQPSAWTQAKRADLLPGEFDGIACDDNGILSLAPEQTMLAKLEQPVISAVLVHDGATYVACAPGGTVRKIAGGEVLRTWEAGATFWPPAATLITCLAAGPGGTILAGAAPGGRILALDDDGKVRDYFGTGEETVWALSSGPGGDLYAGTGPNGKIFVITGKGQGKLLTQLPATNVYALATRYGPNAGRAVSRPRDAVATSGEVAPDAPFLYAGTGNAGVLYAVDSSGQVRAAYDSDQEAVASVAVGPEGDVYAGTAPQAVVVRVRGGGQLAAPADAQVLMQAEGDALVGLAASPDGSLYAVTAEDAVVYRVNPKERTAQVLRKPKEGEAIALALDGPDAIVVGDSNPARITRLAPARFCPRGAFTSKPQQAPPGTRWGALSGAVERPEGTTAIFQTRSGDSPDPDDHWSPWSPPANIDSAVDIVSPAAGFLQYRITLSRAVNPAPPAGHSPTAGEGPANPGPEQPGGAPGTPATPRVRGVQISFLPPNREPTVTISAPKPGERVRKTVDVKWKGEDPDHDKLVYDVSLSADGGSTWQELKADVEGDSYSWDTTAAAGGQKAAAGGQKAAADGQKAKDGAYLLRVVASDRRANDPASARQDQAEQAVWVDNTPPAVLAWRHTVAVSAERKVSLRGAAADELSPLQGVDYRVDDGPWRAAAVEGTVGKRQVSFTVETEALAAGERRVQVRAFDQAGNSAEDEVRVTVESSPAPAAGPPPETSEPAGASPAPDQQ